MAIRVVCSGCTVRLTLGDERAGQAFVCPQCGATIDIPPDARAEAEPPEAHRDADPAPRRWADPRVRVGVFAGAGVLLAAVVIACAVGLRRPAEVADRAAERPQTAAPAPAPPKPAPQTPPPVSVPEVRRPPPVFQPSPPPPEVSAPQFNTQFLGSQGQGRRFCIIADNSSSMSVGAKITDLKAQLLKTIADLDPESELAIFFFNTKTEPMPHPGWLKRKAPEVGAVRAWVGGVRATGGTQPIPAFEAAFALRPPPDVIFFMTDGLIPPAVPTRVLELNTFVPKVAVNTILFASPPPKGRTLPTGRAGGGRDEDMLKRIAEPSGGTFTRYVPKE